MYRSLCSTFNNLYQSQEWQANSQPETITLINLTPTTDQKLECVINQSEARDINNQPNSPESLTESRVILINNQPCSQKAINQNQELSTTNRSQKAINQSQELSTTNRNQKAINQSQELSTTNNIVKK